MQLIGYLSDRTLLFSGALSVPIIAVSGSAVTMSCDTPGASIHFTTDGAAPTAASPVYTSPLSFPSATTINALALVTVGPQVLLSAVASAPCGTPATPVFSPASGSVLSDSLFVAISSATPGAVIHFTTDGSLPSSASPAYSGPIPVSGPVTLQAIAVSAVYGVSAAVSASYTVATPVSTAPTAQLMWKTDPKTDAFTNNPSASDISFAHQTISRIMFYGGYGNTRLSWFPHSWVYIDSSSIYNPGNTSLVTVNPSWVLRDANGKPCFLNWGCSGGICPQYLPDYGNPAFVAWWIANAKALLSIGYIGLFIDDVNMNISASNGSASIVPIDPRTKAPITAANWQLYLVDFLEAVRAAFPKTEIVHNAIWYAVGGNPSANSYLKRQILACDFFNMERGFNDTGITGGTGTYALSTMLGLADQIHALGRRFISQTLTVADGDYYPLACFLLVTNGSDLFCPGDSLPHAWPAIDFIALGTPVGVRYAWNGLLRRDFANGSVFVAAPGASGGGSLPKPYINPAGKPVTDIWLTAKQGAILHV